MPPIFDDVAIMSESRPARDMSCRSTTIPRNQFSAAMPNASTKSTTATTHATGLRTTGPTHFRLAPERDGQGCCYLKYVRYTVNATNG